jgi:hypothetical protein
MAGVYGEISSREAFHRVLAETTVIVQGILAQRPEDSTMQRLYEELEAMKRWSNDGREPTDGERGSIDVGLIAARELPDAKGVEADLVQKLFALNNYFEDWPTDELAANAKDEEFFEAE